MLRRKRILISFAVLAFCFVGVEPAKACGHRDLVDCHMDGKGNLWMMWWNWIDWSLQWEYFGAWDGRQGINLQGMNLQGMNLYDSGSYVLSDAYVDGDYLVLDCF